MFNRGLLEKIDHKTQKMSSDIQDIFLYHGRIKSDLRDIREEFREGYKKLEAENQMLLELLCSKCSTGTIILYNEATPRKLTVIENGKKIDLDSKNEVDFYWTRGELPHLTVES